MKEDIMSPGIRFLHRASPGKDARRTSRNCKPIVDRMEPRYLLNGSFHSRFQQVNLVSDLPGQAKFQDPDLVNPWGIAFGPNTPFWVADNGTGKSTIYDKAGVKQSLVVNIPGPGNTGKGAPTGVVYNGNSSSFIVSAGGKSGHSVFIFATEDGTIAGWSPEVNLTQAIIPPGASSPTAVYKGLALAGRGQNAHLYAANFHDGTIDVYDTNFHKANLHGNFQDPHPVVGYAPFNIAEIGHRLYVTYAKQDADKRDDVPGPGHGYINVFTNSGDFVRRLTTAGALDSPWGMAVAPRGFGRFGGDLLVGNFGDGKINAYDRHTGRFEGTLLLPNGLPFQEKGLWALTFGNGKKAGDRDKLYFTAGIDDEQHGLFGYLAPLKQNKHDGSHHPRWT